MSVVNKMVPEARATKSAAHRVNLTDQVIRRSPALDKPYRIWDIKVPGLFVRIQPSGIRTFNVQWSRTRSASIGKFPHRTLEYARNKAHKVMADAQDHGVPEVAHAKSRPSTFTSFITDHYEPWVTAERKAGKATVANINAQFGPLFDKKPLTDITALAVEKFKATRLRAGIKPTTVNRDLDRLRACLTKAVEWKMLPANPISTVKRSKGGASSRVRYLSADEEKRLRSALAAREEVRRGHRSNGNAWAKARGREPRHEWAPDEYTDHLAPLVLLAINTGLRRGALRVDLEIDRYRASSMQGIRGHRQVWPRPLYSAQHRSPCRHQAAQSARGRRWPRVPWYSGSGFDAYQSLVGTFGKGCEARRLSLSRLSPPFRLPFGNEWGGFICRQRAARSQ